jgi:hypothetical protein
VYEGHKKRERTKSTYKRIVDEEMGDQPEPRSARAQARSLPPLRKRLGVAEDDSLKRIIHHYDPRKRGSSGKRRSTKGRSFAASNALTGPSAARKLKLAIFRRCAIRKSM